MPHGFEYIVRPFQQPGSLGNVVIPGTPQRTPEVAHIVWGGKGTMPSVQIVNPSTIVNTNREDLTEQDRDSDVKRIVGNDGESYVDVARAKTVRLDKEETQPTQSLTRTFSVGGGKIDPALQEFLDDFQSGTVQMYPRSKVTWNMKNE